MKKENKPLKKLLSKVQAAIDKYNMLENDKNIAIGLSGGKDSIFLLYAMNQIKTFHRTGLNIKAITLDPCFYGKETDYSLTTNFCNSIGIEHIIKRVPIWEIIFKIRKEKNPCSLCSRMRHGILHKICNEENCKTIALGHNMDDAVETFFMNIFFGGKISTFSPVSYLSRANLYMIRPLIFCQEDEIANFSLKQNLPICANPCPIDKHSSRENIKNLINSLELKYPKLKKKVINAIETSSLNGW